MASQAGPTRRLNSQTTSPRKGTGATIPRVNRQSRTSNMTKVVLKFSATIRNRTNPQDTNSSTASRSLVRRDMMSPVDVVVK